MPVQLSYPGVYIEEIPSGVRTITGVATSITAFIGWAPRGPSDEAGRVLSWADYERTYGGLHRHSDMSYAVSQFFANGGQHAYIVRLISEGDQFATAELGSLTLKATGEGSWANLYGVVATPQSGDPDRFGLRIYRATDETHAEEDRQTVEVFENLSLAEDDPRFVSSVIDEESRIVNVDKDKVAESGQPVPQTDDLGQPMTGGKDGELLKPNGDDFGNAIQGGRALLERVDLFNMLCVPGLTDSGQLGDLAVFCRKHRAFLIADAPETDNDATAKPITGVEGANAAVYYPWLRMPDPEQEGRLRYFPPSGAVAGIYARTDTTRGVWKAPAGTEASISGARGVSKNLTDLESGELNKKAVNALRTFPVYGPVVWGARTCRGADEIGDEWKYVPVRRTALFLEETLFRSLKWVVFEPNDEPLWAQIRLNVGAFMHDQFRKGAFQGSTPRDAYFVKCDKESTTQSDINLGIVNILVGFAPLKPAEFVVVKLQQMAGQIQV